MKLLLIHSDYMEYETTKAIKNIAEDIGESLKHQSCDEVLVAFNAVEKNDWKNIDEVIYEATETILDAAETVGVDAIFLYPYAHLSSDLAKPKEAVKVELRLFEELKLSHYKVYRAPFGWYKSFKISCKGHPLSELSREIQGTGKKEILESSALKAEDEARSYWYIMDLNGNINEINDDNGKVSGYNFKGEQDLEKFASYEISKSRGGKKSPPHVQLMQKHEIADYEPGSDPGNMRFYPKGRFIKGLLEEYVTERVIEYGGREIESPIMYDYEHPSLKKYLDRFPARQYKIETPDKDVFLRFAACFGQFLMMHDATLSYKQLPAKLYELTRYSFRLEQRGELTGLRRLRAFTMPDCHAFCADMEQAKEEMIVRFKLSRSILENIGYDMENDFQMAIRITKDFYEENRDFIKELIGIWGAPILLEMWNDRFFYFLMKYEWNFVDALDKASALSTDQIDVENAERYNIQFTDENGDKQFPLIMHMSPSGAIERVIYSLLERAYKNTMKGIKPSLPYWLSPTQMRLIPVSEYHLGYCEELCRKFERVRVDIDDTGSTVGKSIRNAEKEWVPFIVVVGDKEKESGELSVRIRSTKEQMKLDIEGLKERLKKEQDDMPFKPHPLSLHMSKRIIFRG